MTEDRPFDLRTGVGVAAIALALHYLTELTAIGWDAPYGTATITGQLALAAVVVIAARGAIRARLGLRWPRPRFLVAAILLGATAWFAHGWDNRWATAAFGPPPSTMASRESLAVALVAVCALPALCEELVFRGVLARSLATGWPAAAAIALSALLFGLYHHTPYNLVSPIVDGAIAAYLTLRARSVVPAMIMHFLHNLFVVLRSHAAPLGFWRWFAAHHDPLLGACALATFTGLVIAWRAP